jgi:hypothetical protein
METMGPWDGSSGGLFLVHMYRQPSGNVAEEFELIEQSIDPTEDNIYTAKLKDTNFDLKLITKWDILLKINALSPYKSASLENISTTLMKAVMKTIIDTFVHLNNLVVETGRFPFTGKKHQ